MALERHRWPARTSLWAAVIVLIAVAAIAVNARTAILVRAGEMLIAEDPLAGADAIVVAVDASEAGVLEAADLVAAGVSSRVAVLAPPDDRSDEEFVRRGLPPTDDAAYEVRRLRLLGVTTAEEIATRVSGTTEQPAALNQWCAERGGFRSIIVVTNRDHSRRLRRVLQRGVDGRCGRVLVRASRYSEFDPQQWWHHRTATRTWIEEIGKLLVDIGLHPFG